MYQQDKGRIYKSHSLRQKSDFKRGYEYEYITYLYDTCGVRQNNLYINVEL